MKRYVIRTFRDFLQVPEDRLADCLSEFADFLKQLRELSICPPDIGVEFEWTDDGKRTGTIEFEFHRGEKTSGVTSLYSDQAKSTDGHPGSSTGGESNQQTKETK